MKLGSAHHMLQNIVSLALNSAFVVWQIERWADSLALPITGAHQDLLALNAGITI